MTTSRRAISLLRTSLRHQRGHKPDRSFASSLASVPFTSQSISNYPFIPSRTDLAPPHDHDPVSSTATSSRIGLDHPFWYPRSDGVVEPLAFATDDELFYSLLLPNGIGSAISRGTAKEKARDKVAGPVHGNWTQATIDPAAAFLALRSRPTYHAFLQTVHPFLSVVYPRLKEAGQHQLLVSDLLLRHPDPSLLRDLLELDAAKVDSAPIDTIPTSSLPKTPRPAQPPLPLRSSLVTSIQSIIGWQIRRSSLAPLGYRSHLAICRALADQKDIPGLVSSWHDLRHASIDINPDIAYTLMRLVLTVSSSDPVAALGMLHSLVKHEIVPRGILLRDIGDHPYRREIIITAAAVVSCLRWNMDVRARKHADELYSLVFAPECRNEDVVHARGAVLVLQEVLRASISIREESNLDWSRAMIIKLLRRSADQVQTIGEDFSRNTPFVPGPLLTAFLDFDLELASRFSTNHDHTELVDALLELPMHLRPIISARNIVHVIRKTRMDQIPNLIEMLVRLDPTRTVTYAETLVPFLTTLDMDATKRTTMFNSLLRHWCGKVNVSNPKAFIQLTRRTRADVPRCAAIIQTYEARLIAEYHRRGEASIEDKLVMVQAFVMNKNPEAAEVWFNQLDLEDPEVRRGLCVMTKGMGKVKIGLRGLLRKRLGRTETQRILSGAGFVETRGRS